MGFLPQSNIILIRLAGYVRGSREGRRLFPRHIFRTLYAIQRAKISPFGRIVCSESYWGLVVLADQLGRGVTFLFLPELFLTKTASWRTPV